MNVFLTMALVAPFLGAALIGVFDPRHVRRIVVITSLLLSLASLVVARPNSRVAWWSPDRLGWFLAVASLVIGLCVCHYAARQFEDEDRGRPFLTTALCVVGCVVSTDLSRTTVALGLSWVMTSVCTVLLLRQGGLERSTSSSWRRAAVTFIVSDGVLVTLFAIVCTRPHAPSALSPWSGHVHGIGALMLVAGAMIAAVGRAGLTLRRSWVTDTINAPTATSALLHAGVVNAGALLVFRAEGLADAPIFLNLVLAACCLVVLVVLAPRIHTRVDLKGQLAASTVAQMSFMLMALAFGYPLLAFTHAVGHGFYKAGRFMAAGGAIEQRAQLRRRLSIGTLLSRVTRSFAVVGIGTVAAIGATWLGGDAPAVMGVFAPAAIVVWWSRSRSALRSSLAVWSTLVATLVAYAALVTVIGGFLALGQTPTAWRAPWWSLGVAVMTVAVSTIRGFSTPSRSPDIEGVPMKVRSVGEMAVLS